MKKLPLHIKILAPLILIFTIALVYFGLKLTNTIDSYNIKSTESTAILAIKPPKVIYQLQKEIITEQSEYIVEATPESSYSKNSTSYYQYKNISFVSYSKQWDEDDLKALCEELLLNKHGSEIDYLSYVIVYGQDDEDVLGTHYSSINYLDIRLALTQFIPSYYTYDMPNNIGVVSLYDGDNLTTVEQMATTLSHEYGHHFTLYYFNLEGDASEIENDAYFKARFVEDMGIKYLDEDRDDYQEYLDDHMWYLVELAAEDYVYLMGSPTTRRLIQYYDSRDILYMQIRNQDDEIDEFYKVNNEASFNQSPHENIVLALPDQVEGLSELFYSQIDADAPEYEDRNEKAGDIQIKVSRHKNQGKTFYKVYWNKPWTSSDVTYTLVAYDEADNLLGAIKSVNATDSTRAYIGSVVIETQNYYHWWNSDFWTDQGFLRFRVVATFSDGSAIISPPLDRSFS